MGKHKSLAVTRHNVDFVPGHAKKLVRSDGDRGRILRSGQSFLTVFGGV